MTTVELPDPTEYVRLHDAIEKSEQLINGKLNIQRINCNKNGKATIVCENEKQKELLTQLLKESSFNARDTRVKNTSFAIFGIAKTRNSEDIISELIRRDKRFKKDAFKVKERFPINSSKDAVVLTCSESLTASIGNKRHVFLGTKGYKLTNFADLDQCFKCSKLGHTAAKCKSKKLCCPNCAKDHTLKECQINFTPECGNCSRVKVGAISHSSWDVRCPYRNLWIRKQKEWLGN